MYRIGQAKNDLFFHIIFTLAARTTYSRFLNLVLNSHMIEWKHLDNRQQLRTFEITMDNQTEDKYNYIQVADMPTQLAPRPHWGFFLKKKIPHRSSTGPTQFGFFNDQN